MVGPRGIDPNFVSWHSSVRVGRFNKLVILLKKWERGKAGSAWNRFRLRAFFDCPCSPFLFSFRPYQGRFAAG
jgi:hypothetical protein